MTLERHRMRLPLIGETLTKFQFAQFCRTLSTLLAGGTPLVQAMETAGGAIRGRLVSGAVTRGGSNGARRAIAAQRRLLRRVWCLSWRSK